MGWGRMFFLGNVGQQLEIEEMRGELDRLRRRPGVEPRSDVDAQIEDLRRENDELRLYLAAVVRHLLEKRLLVRTELEALVSAIDAEDGTTDGRARGPIA